MIAIPAADNCGPLHLRTRRAKDVENARGLLQGCSLLSPTD
jgi:hypothetical protein